MKPARTSGPLRPGKRAWGITDAIFLVVVCILLSVYILQLRLPGG